jgi:hypothetical protein
MRKQRILCLVLSLSTGAAALAADADRIDVHTPLPSTALVLTKSSQGSGFVLDRQGRLLITSHHVTGAKGEVQVVFPVVENGQALVRRDYYLNKAPRIRGTVLGSDSKLDLAAIQLDSVPFEVPELKMAASPPQTGDRTHIVGNPGNRAHAWIYDTGSVSRIGKTRLEYTSGQTTEARMLEIKADGLMAPGASGGPVVNNAGELIGVLSAAGAQRGELLCVEVGEVRRFLGGVHRAQATQAIRAGDYPLAVAHCDRALAVNPDDPLSYNERGAAESFLDRLDDAIADYTQALKLDPKLAVAYRNRGSAYLHQDKWAEAVADCTRALKLDPEYVSAFQVRAKAYRKLGKVDEARADADAAAMLEKKAK